jgi:hypothetical protein
MDDDIGSGAAVCAGFRCPIRHCDVRTDLYGIEDGTDDTTSQQGLPIGRVNLLVGVNDELAICNLRQSLLLGMDRF